MRYQGGKKRIGKKIATSLGELSDAFAKAEGTRYTTYFEPFLGMGGVMHRVTQDPRFKEFIGNDINEDVIVFWDAVQNGWTPPATITKEQWIKLKAQRHPSALRTFCGYGASWGGQFFGGYVKNVPGRDFVGEAQRAVLKTAPPMQDVKLYNDDYTAFEPTGMVIYADPPYANTTGYELYCKSLNGRDRKVPNALCSATGFDSNAFWKKMREWSKDNIVVVSELSAPKDFVAWESYTPISRSLNKQKHGQRAPVKAVEKLYIHKSLAERLGKRRKRKTT